MAMDWFQQNAPPDMQGQRSPLGQMVANSQRRMAGAPQLDPGIGSFTPIVGATKYYDKATGQAIDPSDPRIAAYTQAMQQWGQSQGSSQGRVPGVNGYYENAGDMVSGGGKWVPYSETMDPSTGKPYQPNPGGGNGYPGYPGGGRMPWDEQNPYQPKGPWTPVSMNGADAGTTTGPPPPANSEGPGGFTGGQGLIDPNVVNRAAQQATGGGGQNGAINWGDLQSRLNPNTDIAQWVRDGFQAQGETANDNDINTWSNYWNQWGKNDPGYFFQRFSTPDGGGQQAGGSGGPGGFGSGWNTLPTADQLKANPGFQYALDEAQRGMQNSAAAKGTLLNGRTNQAMSQNLANYALGNFYLPLANLGLNYNQANQDNLYRWGQLGLSGSSVGSTGKPA